MRQIANRIVGPAGTQADRPENFHRLDAVVRIQLTGVLHLGLGFVQQTDVDVGNSSRNLPLKLSTYAFSIGLPWGHSCPTRDDAIIG